MRKLVLALFVLTLSAGVAQAQEVYSLPVGSGNVASLSVVITGRNGALCNRYGLALTCTQAQVCPLAGAAGGASCTAAQARAAKARIFPLTQAGREEFTTFEIALPKFLELVAEEKAEQRRAFCVAWLAKTQPERDAICTGCDPGCP